MLLMLAACSSSSPQAGPMPASTALRIFGQATAREFTSGDFKSVKGVPALHTAVRVVHNAPEAKLLRTVDGERCGGVVRVYTVTGDAARLWHRMSRVEGSVASRHESVSGHNVRVLAESGFDYDITAAMISSTSQKPAVVVEGCG